MTWLKAASGSSYIGARRKHGAVGDAKTCQQGFVTAADLTRFTTNDVGKFTAESVGKVISIPYAGTINAGKTIPKSHVTTIKTYISSSVVELTDPAPTPNDASYTVVGTPTVLGGFAVWGTPNHLALQDWMDDCSAQRKPGELEPADAEGYLVLPNPAHVGVVGGAAMVWPDYCHVKGYGEDGSVIWGGGNGFSVFRYAGSDNVFVIDPQMDEIVVDMAGVSESTYTTTTKAIYLVHWKHGRFENNVWRNSPATAFGSDFPVDGSGVRGNRVVKGGRQVDELGGTAGGSGIGIGTGKYLYEELDVVNNKTENCGFYGVFHEAQTTPNPLARGYRTIGNVNKGGKYGFGEEGVEGCIWANNQSYDTTVAHYRISKAFTDRYGQNNHFNGNLGYGGNVGVESNTGSGRWTWHGGGFYGLSSDAFQFNDTGTGANTPPHPTNIKIVEPDVDGVGGRGVRFLGGSFGEVAILGGRYANIGASTTSRRPIIGVERPVDLLIVKGVRARDERAAGSKMSSYGLELTATAVVGELHRIDNDFPTTGPNALGDGAYLLTAPPTTDRFRTSGAVAGAGEFAFRDSEAPLLAEGKIMVAPPTVSAPATAAATIASGTGNTTSGSPSVTSVATTTGAFVVGQDITGPGIPANTVIKAISGTTITLGSRVGVNVNATANGTGVALTATLGTTFAWTHNAWRPLGAVAVVAGTGFPDNGYGKGVPPTGANTGISMAWEAYLDCQHYEFLVKGNGTRIRIWEEEDGELRLVGPSYTTMANDGSGYKIHVDRGSRVGRRIRIEGSSSFFFGGIKAIANAVLSPPPEPVGPLAVVAGDSFAEGTGVTPAFLGFAWRCCFLAGIRNVHVSASGSTGYLNDGTAGRVRLSTRFDADIGAKAPDLLVICMGINDTSLDQVALRAEVDLVLAKVLALPKVPITVVMGAFFGSNSQAGPTKAVTVVIKAAFNAVASQLPAGSRFVDNDAEAWQTGTGNAAATVGDGNNDYLVGADGTHPNGEAAHNYHANRLAPHIIAATA